MTGRKRFNTQDLVLKVNTTHYDTVKYPLNDWERFLSVLCSTRYYQKESIRTAIHYLISDKYNTIEDLAKENYIQNIHLQERCHDENGFLSKIQLPQKRSASIDLATGTGKSYVMYGIAQIALGLGLVDKVLVLGPPSLTIERALTEKFTALSSKPDLKTAIPQSSKFSNPSIINASRTIKDGCICIENINAVYSKNQSSIFDSLGMGKGGRCLILNDEVHHVYNKTQGNTTDAKNIKKWKEFLLDGGFAFKFILGFTGTAYIENDYFNDVIYRFSLRQAIENNFVKTINYVVENTDLTENEKFQKVLQNHKLNKDTYSSIKPLTILITKDIQTAKQLETRFVEFLAKHGEGTEDYIRKNRILIVTSDKDHKSNILKLPYVDSSELSVEWIISVSMLTEGWDVQNVFQIVPMEERAFNSKLLIAQVLGRGLRVPQAYPNKPEVIVFNHDKWSARIKDLVEEILEMETRVRNSPILEGKRSKHHFSVYNLNYEKDRKETLNDDTEKFNYKDFINLSSETFTHETVVKYVRVGDKEFQHTYTIEKEKFHVSQIVDTIYDDFRNRLLEGVILNLNKNEYTSDNLPSKPVIADYIDRSMKRVGITENFLGRKNRQAVFAAFSTLLRKKPRSIQLVRTPNDLFTVSTMDRDHESVSALTLHSGTTIFFTNDYENEIVLEDSLAVFKELHDNINLPVSAFIDRMNISLNINLFKTPIDLVFSNYEPERKFIIELVKNENAEHITAWFKSKNQNFYSIEYSYTKGTHTDSYQFNPDFFILIKDENYEYVSVVEIKSDDDDSEENKQKYKYAAEHFKNLNERLKENGINQTYLFNFLSPSLYSDYFSYLRDGRLTNGEYISELDILLQKTVSD